MTSMLGSALPIVAAPMAGGPTTPALTAAVAAAGAFPFIPAGYLSSAALASTLDEAAALQTPYGVNLFVPSGDRADPHLIRRYAAELEHDAAALGIELDPLPVWDDDAWHGKLALAREQQVPVVSFTFGLPQLAEIAQLQRAGSAVFITVTTPEEAVFAREAGADGIIVQGPRAGGHSGTFTPQRAIIDCSTASLLRRVREAVQLPTIAAGGVDGPEPVHQLLDAGATAVAVGTLLLRTDEAGTSATHRAALADPEQPPTTLTHAFTGRPARALLNDFIRRHHDTAPLGYPEVHFLTRPLRQAAARAGRSELLHLWAGTGYPSAPTGAAADVIRSLV